MIELCIYHVFKLCAEHGDNIIGVVLYCRARWLVSLLGGIEVGSSPWTKGKRGIFPIVPPSRHQQIEGHIPYPLGEHSLRV